MANHKVDHTQIPGLVYDTENQAYKVVFVGGQMAISLDKQEDSISIAAVQQSHSFSLSPDSFSAPVSAVGMKKLSLFGSKEHLEVYVSPSASEDVWFLLDASSSVVDVCASRVKVKAKASLPSTSTCYIVLQG